MIIKLQGTVINLEYISAEEFLKQPIEIQKVFLNWWKPSLGDLFVYDKSNTKSFAVLYADGEIENYIYNKGDDDFKSFKTKAFPLLTEGQLRKFIEDKTGFKVEVRLTGYTDIDTYDISFGFGEKGVMRNLGTDLLQAYWAVAFEIAKEKVNS